MFSPVHVLSLRGMVTGDVFPTGNWIVVEILLANFVSPGRLLSGTLWAGLMEKNIAKDLQKARASAIVLPSPPCLMWAILRSSRVIITFPIKMI